MAKIYNEVVIDMNPESPTFEETLYEDSYEYEGDMMYAGAPPSSQPEAENYMKEAGRNSIKYEGKYYYYYSDGFKEIDPKTASGFSEDAYPDITTKMQDFDPTKTSDQQTNYGLESLSKKDFFQDDGKTPKPLIEVVDLIIQHKPVPEGQDGEQYRKDVEAKVKDLMPKLQAIPEEEKGFAREGFQQDVYGISKDAGKAGAQMQQAYGSGMGSSMRGAYGAQKDVAQQFKQAEQGYAQDIYGLGQEQEGEFETNIGTWLQGFKQGGRVPSKQTFLDVLSKIPDAGGN